MKIEFSHKLVAVMNKDIEPGKVMNALAHMCVGLGAKVGAESLRLEDYYDADGGKHPNISDMPFIILSANSNKIRKLREEILQQNIDFVDFTDTMTIGTYVEQIEKTRQTPEANLNYYGIVMYGEWEQVSQLTRKFSLWK